MEGGCFLLCVVFQFLESPDNFISFHHIVIVAFDLLLLVLSEALCDSDVACGIFFLRVISD